MNAPHRSEIILIAAVARNGIIGRDNALPWRLKADLAHFRAVTMGHPVLMGRKTWESLAKPLPGRRNLVLTRQPDYRVQGAEVFASVDEALDALKEAGRVFVIGGAEIYRVLLQKADILLLSEVAADVAGDARFPDFDRARFREVSRTAHPADADNEYAVDFVEYRRTPHYPAATISAAAR
ncbi:MAG: dihydrofolate reductase [Azoarcus sp.]|jgi:dihydrofolate reductase|nr:dihydrofolate reductase [Azoarcus sp.]